MALLGLWVNYVYENMHKSRRKNVKICSLGHPCVGLLGKHQRTLEFLPCAVGELI